ncbi:hypothetical protein [Limnohabitans sp.]|uniref:hypothetical protein n=1 Tax=Limnohabitans sp. TaxID=1907725 RepID=UPI003340B590
MAKTEIAAQSASSALAIMSDLEQDAGAGFDGMTQEDYALPFLRLLTSTSPEVGEVDGALPGMMLNSVTGELFDGKKGIAVVPCAYVRQYIEWMPRGQGSGAPVHIYPATSDILSQTHKEPGDNKDYLDNGNYIENTANYYVMVISDAGVPEPALITMKSTQLKKSRKWNSMMQSVKVQGKNGMFTPPMYSQVYKLTTVAESNDKGKWYGWEVERTGAVESADIYNAAKAFAQSVGSGDVKVKHESETGAAGNNAAPF